MIFSIVILTVIFFVTFYIISKNKLTESILFTVWFIVTLWINIPCFVVLPDGVDVDSNLIMLPFKINNEFGMPFIIMANIVLNVTLYWLTKISGRDTYSYKEIKSKYDEFVDDAMELYIVGKDLDFLYKNSFKKQTNRILHLGSKCNLLCESTKDQQLLELYGKVRQQGVEVRFYKDKDNLTNLKGQIKIDQNGNKKAIFTMRKSGKYLLISIENQFLVGAILERYIEVFKKADLSVVEK